MITQTEDFLRKIKSISTTPALSKIYDFCTTSMQELHRPLRVAITGMIKTGKSTLLNALLGQNIVPTAVEVMTYNVNWFRHIKYSPDQTECFVVHYLNGVSEKYPIREISAFVGYNEKRREIIDSIHYVDAYIDNPLLEIFDLIDTPGLNSLLGTDSQHTKDLLTKEENRPDAIIYLISGEFQIEDVEEVAKFNISTGLLSGINTIAALTRVDEAPGQYEGALDIINYNKERYAEIRYNFSEIYAIAALPALASKTLSDEEISLIKELAKNPDVETLLATKEQFWKSDWYDRDTRNQLIEKLSIKGLKLLTAYFQKYPMATTADCRKFLFGFSRVGELQQIIISRFGERADFYKSNIVLARLRKVCKSLSRNSYIVSDNRSQLQQILMLINQYELVLHQQYADYYLLNDYYNQESYFDDDEWERIKRLLGENGKEDYQCLNLSKTATEEQIVSQYESELAYWKKKVNLAIVMNNHTRQQSAKQMVELINHKLNNHKS